VYLQFQDWKGLAAELNPRDWGWQECEEGFMPPQASLPPAPEHLLQVVINVTARQTVIHLDAHTRSTKLITHLS